jgi:hypothetical protein
VCSDISISISISIKEIVVTVGPGGEALAVAVRIVDPTPRGPGLARRALPERSATFIDTVGEVV